MTRPTDAAIARAFWEVLAENLDLYDAPDFYRFLSSVKIKAEQVDAETVKVTTSPERVQIPAESDHVAPFDRCPKCTAHMPVGQTCGGVNCGLRRTE